MTDGQASEWLMQNSASFVKSQGNVQWWRLPDGSWVSKTGSGSSVELRRHAANSCNCG